MRGPEIAALYVKSIVTIVPILAGTCDLESLVAGGHKKMWRPPAANMGFCDFKDVVAFGNNQLWLPLAAKVKGHHSGLSKKNGQLKYPISTIGTDNIGYCCSRARYSYLQLELLSLLLGRGKLGMGIVKGYVPR